MPPSIKFNFKNLEDLSTDFSRSVKSLPFIFQKVLVEHLRPIRQGLRGLMPRQTGALQRSFGYSVRRRRGVVTGSLGFFTNRRVPAHASIAANVLQKPGATPRKGQYLWIPIGSNRAGDGRANISPRDLLTNGFVRQSKAGNMIAFQRQGDQPIPMFVLKRAIRFAQPPVPFESRVEAEVPRIIDDIPEFVAQVLEARRAAIGAVQ